MRSFCEAAIYLGSWQWDVPQNRVVVGEDIARAYGIDDLQAREGVCMERFRERILPDDRPIFDAAIERAQIYGGQLSFAYRLMAAEDVIRVQVNGECVKAENGRPVEYLGAVHSSEEYATQPIVKISDHLIAAAQLARLSTERSLAQFIDMALFEAATLLASQQKQRLARESLIAVSNRRV